MCVCCKGGRGGASAAPSPAYQSIERHSGALAKEEGGVGFVQLEGDAPPPLALRTRAPRQAEPQGLRENELLCVRAPACVEERREEGGMGCWRKAGSGQPSAPQAPAPATPGFGARGGAGGEGVEMWWRGRSEGRRGARGHKLGYTATETRSTPHTQNKTHVGGDVQSGGGARVGWEQQQQQQLVGAAWVGWCATGKRGGVNGGRRERALPRRPRSVGEEESGETGRGAEGTR